MIMSDRTAEETLDMRGAGVTRCRSTPPTPGYRDCPGALNTLPIATTATSLILVNRDPRDYSSSRYLPMCNYAARIRHRRSCK